MIGALFFLVRNSWVNSMKLRIRRLKQPKYLIGAIFGLLYIVYLFGIRIAASFAHFGQRRGAGMVTPENAQMFEALGALILFVLVFLGWIFGRERASLIFSEAEVAFLFPAPVSRKALIRYKLIKSQVAILIMILFLTIIFGRFWSGGMAWLRSLGWWVILTTLNLHIIAASFAREKLIEHGISNWKRRTGVLMLAGAAAVGVFIWARQTIPPPPHVDFADGGMTTLKYYFEEASKAGPLPYLLYPFRIVVRPYIEAWVGTFGSFLVALAPAILLMAAHYWWVMRADVAFEEASVEASKRMAEKVATMRANRGQWVSKPTKKKRPPFKLKPSGPPSVGLLWKNLIGAGSMFTWRFWLIMGCVLIPVGTSMAANPSSESVAAGLGFVALMILVMSIMIGPQMIRQDFRHDLAMADVLKTYPLRGWQMALGELLAPAVILTGLQWLLLIFATTLMSEFGHQEVRLGPRLAVAIGAAVIVPGLNVVSLLIPNASVLMFPGWFQSGKEGPQGIEAMGQRIVFMFGSMIAFGVSMLLPTVLFAVIYVLAQFVIGPVWPVPLASLGASLVLATEAGFGVWWLGKMFDKFDIAAEA